MEGSAHPAEEADTRRRIIRAALEEFTRSGYKGSSTRMIAERAGVNEVTLFRHFGSKLELLRAAVSQMTEQVQIPDDVTPYLELPIREGLQRIISEYFSQITLNCDILMLGIGESFSHPQIAEDLKGFVWKVRAALLQYFERLHAAGRLKEADFPVITHMILGLLHGTPAIRKRAPQDVTVHLTDERILAAIVNTICAAYSIEDELQ